MDGWMGTILRVNLTKGTVTREPTSTDLAHGFIGARGLGAKIISDEVDPSTDALGPRNKLIFAPGPFTGTFAPSAGRYDVITKSPLNGTIAASNSGGNFGSELKYAGYDALIVEGKAVKPVYIWIKDDVVEIRDASEIWGTTVNDATEALRAATEPEAEVACIGPAGENLSLIAAIMNDLGRAAGRTGVGAVMGSKKLKAVVVVGSNVVRVAKPAEFKDAVMVARAAIAANPVGGAGLKAFGSNVLVNILNEVGSLPTRNFQESYFPTADKIGGETLSATLLQRPKGCYSCTISCGRATKVTNPDYAGVGEGPEYETAWGFGSDSGIDDLEAITKANYLCNEYGLDTISMASTIACAMELFERGYLTKADTDGVDLKFGNTPAMVDAVRKTGVCEGFGKRLAEGSYRLAESVGHPELAMTVKKQEMPAYDPRGIQGIGLNYATNNRGGCHVRGYTVAVEVLGQGAPTDPHATEGKPELTVIFQNLTAALDATGCCLFATFGEGAPELAAMLSTLTGVDYSVDEFLKAGERIWNLERLWNLKIGYTKDDDVLPPRLTTEPIPFGPSKGEVSHVPEMLPTYYQVRGWDTAGVPTADKLAELSLT